MLFLCGLPPHEVDTLVVKHPNLRVWKDCERVGEGNQCTLPCPLSLTPKKKKTNLAPPRKSLSPIATSFDFWLWSYEDRGDVHQMHMMMFPNSQLWTGEQPHSHLDPAVFYTCHLGKFKEVAGQQPDPQKTRGGRATESWTKMTVSPVHDCATPETNQWEGLLGLGLDLTPGRDSLRWLKASLI